MYELATASVPPENPAIALPKIRIGSDLANPNNT